MVSDVLGIDIGGSGIKGAPVDLLAGRLRTERLRVETPQPATPDLVADVVAEIATHFEWSGRIGCTFPAIVKQGVAYSAANVDASWIGTDADALFEERTGCQVSMLNDADAAGLAEMAFGAGQGRTGVVLVLTFGTGIGSGLFVDGTLVPNTELGHLDVGSHHDVELWTSARARERDGLTYDEWGERVNVYLQHVARLFSPDLIIVGGGVSKRFALFADQLQLDVEVVPASLRNEAGIVGAALHAA